MPNLSELYEKRAALSNQLIAMTKDPETRWEEQEVENNYQTLDKDHHAVDELIQKMEARGARASELEAGLKKSLAGVTFSYAGGVAQGAHGAANRQGNPDQADILKERRSAFGSFLRGGEVRLNEAERRALRVDDPAKGGFLTVPQEMSTELIQNVHDLTFFRQIARVLPALAKAQSIGFPSRNSTYNDYDWESETALPAEDDSLTLGKREMVPHMFSKLVKVSRDLIARSALDPVTLMFNEVDYKAAGTQENQFLNGNGDKKPLGCLVADARGISTGRDVIAGASNLPTLDGWIDAEASVKEQYKGNDFFAITHRSTVAALRKKKDNNGQYLWQPAVAGATPEMLANVPIKKSEFVTSVTTAGTYFGVMGNFKRCYWIQDALEMFVQQFNEKYADARQIGWLVEMWVDGAPVIEEGFARLKGG